MRVGRTRTRLSRCDSSPLLPLQPQVVTGRIHNVLQKRNDISSVTHRCSWWRRGSISISVPVHAAVRYWRVSGKPFALIQATSRVIGCGLFRAVRHTVTSKCHAYSSTSHDGDRQSLVRGDTKVIPKQDIEAGCASRSRCAADNAGRSVKR